MVVDHYIEGMLEPTIIITVCGIQSSHVVTRWRLSSSCLARDNVGDIYVEHQVELTIGMSSTEASTPDALVPSASNVRISGRDFVDQHGRILDLRGANVSSASKVYVLPRQTISDPGEPLKCFSPQKVPSSLSRHAESSYVGRPFPLEEADEHWARLKSWGLTFRECFSRVCSIIGLRCSEDQCHMGGYRARWAVSFLSLIYPQPAHITVDNTIRNTSTTSEPSSRAWTSMG